MATGFMTNTVTVSIFFFQFRADFWSSVTQRSAQLPQVWLLVLNGGYFLSYHSWGFQLLSCISKLESQIKDLLTSCSQRQGNEHDIRDHIAAVHLIWFRISALTAYMKEACHDTLWEIETQHPLVSGWKPCVICPSSCLKKGHTKEEMSWKEIMRAIA